jgi:DNA mismatch endonuclease, patch repair protein
MILSSSVPKSRSPGRSGMRYLLLWRPESRTAFTLCWSRASKLFPMTDVFTKRKRSWIMARVHGRDTKPELAVRSIVHRLGFRFRLGGAGLPGRPDLVLPRLNKVIFVHGCFWHGHKGCRRVSVPESNVPFWRKKLQGNADRDRRNYTKLRRLGWSYLVIWQCLLRDPKKLMPMLRTFLRRRAGQR